MLHGVTGHARTWDEEAAAVTARYRVLALRISAATGTPILRSDGDYTVAAMAGDLTAFADALGLAACRSSPISMGGRVAHRVRRAQPRRVQKLVSSTSARDISPIGRARIGHAHGPAPGALRELRGRLRLPASDQPALHRRDASPPRPARHRPVRAASPGVRPGGSAMPPLRHVSDPIDLWALWRAIACPVLIVRGGDSDVLELETAKRMVNENSERAARPRWPARRPHGAGGSARHLSRAGGRVPRRVTAPSGPGGHRSRSFRPRPRASAAWRASPWSE